MYTGEALTKVKILFLLESCPN